MIRPPTDENCCSKIHTHPNYTQITINSLFEFWNSNLLLWICVSCVLIFCRFNSELLRRNSKICVRVCVRVHLVLTRRVWLCDVRLQGISHALTLPTVLDWKMRKHGMILSRVGLHTQIHPLTHTHLEKCPQALRHTQTHTRSSYFLGIYNVLNSFNGQCYNYKIKEIQIICHFWRISALPKNRWKTRV